MKKAQNFINLLLHTATILNRLYYLFTLSMFIPTEKSTMHCDFFLASADLEGRFSDSAQSRNRRAGRPGTYGETGI